MSAIMRAAVLERCGRAYRRVQAHFCAKDDEPAVLPKLELIEDHHE